MLQLIGAVLMLIATTNSAAILSPPDYADNPVCREEKEQLLPAARSIIEALEEKNALLERKVAALEYAISKLKPNPTMEGAK